MVSQNARRVLAIGCTCSHEGEANLHHEEEDADHHQPHQVEAIEQMIEKHEVFIPCVDQFAKPVRLLLCDDLRRFVCRDEIRLLVAYDNDCFV